MTGFRIRALHAAFVSALLLGAPALARAGDWIADAKTGCKVWNPRPAPGETVSWTGYCKGGFADGKGVLEWLRGAEFLRARRRGMAAGRQAGEGTQTWPGGRYKGQLWESLPHGNGVLIFGEARYDGAFLSGKAEWQGRLDERDRHVRRHLGGRMF